MKSWSTVFHVLCFGWLSLRGAFWFLTLTASSKWGNSLFYLLYWVPCPLEFGSFLLLPLFFAQILYPKEWRTYWNYVCTCYIAVVVGATVFMICWAILRERLDVNCEESGGLYCFYSEYTSYPLRCVTAICFIFLAVTQAAYGLKMAYLRKWQYLRFVISSRRGLAIVNTILVLSFLSRGAYQVVSITEGTRVHFPELPLESETDVSLALFLIFMFWDYIPLALVILTVTTQASRMLSLVSMKIKYRTIPESQPNSPRNSSPFSQHTSLPFSYQTQTMQQPISQSPQQIAQSQIPQSPPVSYSFERRYNSKEFSSVDDFSVPGSVTGSGLNKSLGQGRPNIPPTLSGRHLGREEVESSKFDLSKRFEAPVSLTPTSSWLSGLGHISDDPQKYWRGTSPPDREILGYGISPMPLQFPCQSQSRPVSGSYESGFSYEELEKAVLQAQREERRKAEIQKSNKKKPEADRAERVRQMAIDRERDLERERERLRKLDMDRASAAARQTIPNNHNNNNNIQIESNNNYNHHAYDPRIQNIHHIADVVPRAVQPLHTSRDQNEFYNGGAPPLPDDVQLQQPAVVRPSAARVQSLHHQGASNPAPGGLGAGRQVNPHQESEDRPHPPPPPPPPHPYAQNGGNHVNSPGRHSTTNGGNAYGSAGGRVLGYAARAGVPQSEVVANNQQGLRDGPAIEQIGYSTAPYGNPVNNVSPGVGARYTNSPGYHQPAVASNDQRHSPMMTTHTNAPISSQRVNNRQLERHDGKAMISPVGGSSNTTYSSNSFQGGGGDGPYRHAPENRNGHGADGP